MNMLESILINCAFLTNFSLKFRVKNVSLNSYYIVSIANTFFIFAWGWKIKTIFLTKKNVSISVTCSTPTVKKCQAALRTLPGFPFFLPTCLCQDQLCNDFRELIFDHPFNKVKSRGETCKTDLTMIVLNFVISMSRSGRSKVIDRVRECS